MNRFDYVFGIGCSAIAGASGGAVIGGIAWGLDGSLIGMAIGAAYCSWVASRRGKKAQK